jgi:hypothetical protein
MSMEEAETTLHDDLSTAYDSVTESEPAPSTPSSSTTSTESEPVKELAPTEPGRARDERGKFAAKPKAGAAQPNGAAKPSQADGEGAAAHEASQPAKGAAAPVSEHAQPALKAPQSWKPAAREKWASLPPEVQADAVRREREIETAQREAAGASKGYAEFQRTVAPFEAMIRAEGSTPMQAVESLLRASVALRTAPPGHKAQMIAAMVQQYGVPIEALDAALAGQPMPREPQQEQQFRDPRVDDMIARAKYEQSARDQRLVSEATSTIDAFADSHEFFADVLPDFELVYEAMAKRNPNMEPDFQTVYDRAVAMNPEIGAIVAQRKAAESATTSQGATQRARQAASSIKSRPTVSAGNSDTRTRDLRSDIEAAMEEVAAR